MRTNSKVALGCLLPFAVGAVIFAITLGASGGGDGTSTAGDTYRATVTGYRATDFHHMTVSFTVTNTGDIAGTPACDGVARDSKGNDVGDNVNGGRRAIADHALSPGESYAMTARLVNSSDWFSARQATGVRVGCYSSTGRLAALEPAPD